MDTLEELEARHVEVVRELEKIRDLINEAQRRNPQIFVSHGVVLHMENLAEERDRLHFAIKRWRAYLAKRETTNE